MTNLPHETSLFQCHWQSFVRYIKGMKAVWRTPHSSLADVGPQTAWCPKVPYPGSSATGINTDHHIIMIISYHFSYRLGSYQGRGSSPFSAVHEEEKPFGCASLDQIAIRNKSGRVRDGGEALKWKGQFVKVCISVCCACIVFGLDLRHTGKDLVDCHTSNLKGMCTWPMLAIIGIGCRS